MRAGLTKEVSGGDTNEWISRMSVYWKERGKGLNGLRGSARTEKVGGRVKSQNRYC